MNPEERVSIPDKSKTAAIFLKEYATFVSSLQNPRACRLMSDEHRRKLSESLKGKLAGPLNPNFGKPRSEESKRKQSESMKATHEIRNREKTISSPISKVATRKNGVMLPKQWLGKVIKCSTTVAGNEVELVKEVKPKGPYSCKVNTPSSWAGTLVRIDVTEEVPLHDNLHECKSLKKLVNEHEQRWQECVEKYEINTGVA